MSIEFDNVVYKLQNKIELSTEEEKVFKHHEDSYVNYCKHYYSSIHYPTFREYLMIDRLNVKSIVNDKEFIDILIMMGIYKLSDSTVSIQLLNKSLKTTTKILIGFNYVIKSNGKFYINKPADLLSYLVITNK